MDSPPAAGQYLFSKTIHHAGDESLPVGGATVDVWADPETGEQMVKVVGVYRGQVFYRTLPLGDTAPGMSGDVIRADVLRDLLLALAVDEARRKDPLLHLHTKTVLAGVLQRYTAA